MQNTTAGLSNQQLTDITENNYNIIIPKPF